MIKRVQHQQDKKQLAEEMGLDSAEAVADYDESSDESSSDDSSDSSSEEDSSEAGEADSASAPKKRKSQLQIEGKSGKKAKTGDKSPSKKSRGEEEHSSDEEEDSDDDSDSDDEEDESEDADPADSKTALPPMSAGKALTDPLYIKPDAPSYKDFQHRTCILCPSKLIKTEQMAKTHVESASHRRALKRYSAHAKREVPADKMDFYGEGMIDPRHLVAEAQAKLQKQRASQEASLKHSEKLRLERRQTLEKIKELKKRVLRGEEMSPEEKEKLTKRERRSVYKAKKKLIKKAREEAKKAAGVPASPNKKRDKSKKKKEKREKKMKSSNGSTGLPGVKSKRQGPRAIAKAKKLAAQHQGHPTVAS